MLEYAQPADAIVVVGIDRLGRSAVEVMLTVKDRLDREAVIRSLREGSTVPTPPAGLAWASWPAWPRWSWN